MRCGAMELGVVAGLLACVVACGPSGPAPIVVGSKNFTEQRVLGEIVAQTLEKAGLPVARKLDLGGTLVCDKALRAGDLDVYVEYTGTALTAVLGDAPQSDPAAVLARVRAGYDPAGLEWTAPLGFDNTFALVVRPDVAARTLSDAATAARGWTAAFGYEFQARADGYPRLREVYGLDFATVRTMDLGLLYRGLLEGQVDLVVGSATDGLIAKHDLVVLADDRHAFPPYEAVPVVRRDALARHPDLAPALASLGGRLDAATMRRMNLAVDGEHRSPADVAAAWIAAGRF